jgi:hypothetical protein
MEPRKQEDQTPRREESEISDHLDEGHNKNLLFA